MGQKKSNKGNQQPERTPQEDAQLLQILAQYRQIAQSLGKSRTEAQITVILAPITALPESSQIALLKALAKDNTTAAADIALAVNTYAPVKEVRKEARRALIRLEGMDTYPEWKIPTVMSLTDVLGTSAFDEIEVEDDDILDADNIVERFLDSWSEGEYEEAYDLLTTTSPLRAGLARDEWVARRNAWAAKAEPINAQIDVGYGLEFDDEDLIDALDETAEELDTFWSLELKNVSSDNSIPELPMATIVYPATGRHWFWAAYTFLLEDGEWRIHSMRDKGADALQLPVKELERRLHEISDEIHSMSEVLTNDDEQVESEEQKDNEQDESDNDESGAIDIEEVGWFTKQAMHFCDALIAQSPQEEPGYELASQQAVLLHDLERAAAYFTLIADRFPEQRGTALRALGMACTELTIEEDEENLDLVEYQADEEDQVQEFTSRFLPIAEKALRDAIATDNAFASYILLAELFINQNKHIDEAKTLFEQAQSLTIDPKELAIVEVGKARLAHLQNKLEEALTYYQRAAATAPTLSGVWYSIGELQLSLKQKEEAIRSFIKSTEVDPTTTDAYGDLATLYVEQDNDEAALKILQQGIAENPFAADLIASESMLYINEGNVRKAEELIEKAEELEPEMEIVQVVRQVIEMQKEQQRQQRPASKKTNKSKKRR